MISVSDLAMSYGEKLLFCEVDLILSAQKRYALVGANGSGKSTFLRLLTGEEEPMAGSVNISKESRVGWLKQDQFRYEDTVILDVVLQGKPALWEAFTKKEKLLQQDDWNEKNIHLLSQLEDKIAHLGGYTAYSFAEKLLMGLGIHEAYHTKPLSALSGGFKLRVLLAQALFQEPDILLLDEPTNHLDVLSIGWLERYLKNEFRGLVLFISHDVEFINHLADAILDIDYGEVRVYSGQYDKFLEEKRLIEEQKLHVKKNLEQKIASMQRFVDKFKASAARAKQAQSRMKQIERIDLPDIQHSSRAYPAFRFVPNRPSGKQVLKVTQLGKDFKEKKLFHHLSFEVKRGDKIAILGENGIGKSTLMKILVGKLNPDEGQLEWGHETHVGYFSQDHHDLLNQKMSVLTWLNEQATDIPEQVVRKTLGQVLFTQSSAEKNILALSGGEAARLLLARIMLTSANVLVLDEPTNHLDIEAAGALADALRAYTGTLLLVSHDRHFIQRIATRIFMLSHAHGLKEVERLEEL